MTLKLLVDDNTSLSELKDSNYVDKYKEETEDKVAKRKDLKIVDFDKSINRDGKERIEDEDKGLSVDIDKEDPGKDEFDKEESEDYNNNSNLSDKVNTKDKDVKGLSVKIVDVDDKNDIFNLEL